MSDANKVYADYQALIQEPQRAWARYEPRPDRPWNTAAVAHTHRRAGFAAPADLLNRDQHDGPDRTISRLLEGETVGLDGLDKAATDRQADLMANQVASGNDINPLFGCWLYRMIHTASPLRERMTMFWHDHFSTSFAKVNDVGLMHRQNRLFREFALGDFSGLVREIGKDPAMLVFLDAVASRKRHPNENYARELMELFTLGRGHYSEKDIQEAARAFTGRFVVSGEFSAMDRQHDDGTKTILGRTGRYQGEDVAAMLLEQPACAEFLCRKLFTLFIDDIEPPSSALVAPLAETFRASRFQIAPVVEKILRSECFHHPAVRRRKVKSPVEFTVGLVRALRLVKPTVKPVVLAEQCRSMGQALFSPPSVAGWDGGAAWLNTATVLARTNFALDVVSPQSSRLGRVFSARDLPSYAELDAFAASKPQKTQASEVANLTDYYLSLLLADAVDTPLRDAVLTAVASAVPATATAKENAPKRLPEADRLSAARTALGVIAASPLFQLA